MGNGTNRLNPVLPSLPRGQMSAFSTHQLRHTNPVEMSSSSGAMAKNSGSPLFPR
jgi:hypothetical protein